MKAALVFLLGLVAFALGAEQPLEVFGSVGCEGEGEFARNAGTAQLSAKALADLHARLEGETYTLSVFDRVSIDDSGTPANRLLGLSLDLRPFPSLDVRLGIQRVSMGLSPTRSLLDALDPADDEEGFASICVGYLPADSVSFAAVADLRALSGSVGPEFWKEMNGAAIVRFVAVGLEAEAVCTFGWERFLRPGLSLSYDLAGIIVSAGGGAEFISQNKYPVADDAAPFGVGFREGERDGAYWVAQGSAMYNVSFEDWDLSLYAEGLYTQLGYSGTEAGLFYDLAATGGDISPSFDSFGNPPGLGNWYLAVSGGGEIPGCARAELSGILNLNDASCVITTEISWIGFDGVDFFGKVLVPVGNGERSEFGGRSAVVTAGFKAYF